METNMARKLMTVAAAAVQQGIAAILRASTPTFRLPTPRRMRVGVDRKLGPTVGSIHNLRRAINAGYDPGPFKNAAARHEWCRRPRAAKS